MECHNNTQRRLFVAPMLDWTDRHDRYFLRLFSTHTWLFTEMVVAKAILYGNVDRLLSFNEVEQPLILQLGGSDPTELANACRIANEYNYQEINLNVGCPSSRVQSGQFGACLMADPQQVGECVKQMQAVSQVPVSVKHRIGIDHQDAYTDLTRFVEIVAGFGCRTFYVHARKAWLSGLSPKQNREIPPLKYDYVQRLKQAFPELEIIINGGITSLSEVETHLQWVDGVMIGRAAYENPYILALADQQIFATTQLPLSREQILQRFLSYIEIQLNQGVTLQKMTRHILGLYHGMPGARAWRRCLTQHAPRPGAGLEVIESAVQSIAQFSREAYA